MESVFLDIDEELVPFFLDQIQSLNGQKMILTLEEVDSSAAAALVGKEVYLSREFMPEPANDQEFLEQELIGWSAVDVERGTLGHVEGVLDNTAQQLFLIESPENGRILVPAVEAFIAKVDRNTKTIYLQLPEGLVDLNK